MITPGNYRIIDSNSGTVWQMNVKSVNRKNGTLIADWFMAESSTNKPYTIRDRNDDISSIQDLFNNSDWIVEKLPEEHFDKDLFNVS